MKWRLPRDDNKFHCFFSIIPVRTDWGEWVWLEIVYYKCYTGILGETVFHWYSKEDKKRYDSLSLL